MRVFQSDGTPSSASQTLVTANAGITVRPTLDVSAGNDDFVCFYQSSPLVTPEVASVGIYDFPAFSHGFDFDPGDFPRPTGPSPSPDVAVSGDANRVAVAWREDASTIKAAVFSINRTPLDGFVLLGSVATASSGTIVGRPRLAMDQNGDFVVVAQVDGDIQFHLFDSNGNSVQSGTVNTLTNSSQLEPDVAVDDAGNFVVVWTSFARDSLEGDVKFRRFTNTGIPDSNEDFVPQNFVGKTQGFPSVAADADGDFVVVWLDVNAGDVYGRLFPRDFKP